MEVVALAAGLLSMTLALWGAARRERGTSPDRLSAAQLTPVTRDTQRTAAELLRSGRTVRATSVLKRDTGASLGRAHALTRQLAEGNTLPTTWSEAVHVLRRQYPELDGEIRRLLHQRDRYVAIRKLRRQLPIDLVTGHHLVRAYPEADSTER